MMNELLWRRAEMGFRIAVPTVLFLATWILALSAPPVVSYPLQDVDALIDFVSRLPHTRALNWSLFTSVCESWVGVTCNDDGSRVVGLHLPGFGFRGEVPLDTLSRLTALEVLSLRSNALTGPFPDELLKLTALSELHLQFNEFSGPLPMNFPSWRNLTVLDLSCNGFKGSIPSSMSNLTQLIALDLSNNSLDGNIPDLKLGNLKFLNFSFNQLGGNVPKSLQGFPASSFMGNQIYQYPASPIALSPGASVTGSRKLRKKLGGPVLLGVVIGGFMLVSVFIFIILFSRRRGKDVGSGKMAKWDRSPEKIAKANQDKCNHLVFFEGFSLAFDLEDLLRASAEVLGKGTFGTAYKAIMEDSVAVVVKRLKDVGVGKREFEQQMEMVGRLRHENLLELRAYYYSKDEKLMVYDYCSQGSVFSMLHGKRGDNRDPLSWESRLIIALGAARGLAYIHAANGGKLIHGNIKSTNIFLNSSHYGCISDLGISTLVNPSVPPVSRTAGYRAPEVVDNCKATQMSDVYSFGVVLLELLTGKSPIQVTGGGDEVIHLVRWVQSVVREEWTAEVFDVELMRFSNIEEEMVEMLQIAMSCVLRMPDQRPKISDVVKLIEDVLRLDTRNPPSPTRSDDPNGSMSAP